MIIYVFYIVLNTKYEKNSLEFIKKYLISTWDISVLKYLELNF